MKEREGSGPRRGRACACDRRRLLRTGACAGLGLALGSSGLSCCRCVPPPVAAKLTRDEFAMWGYCCMDCEKCDAYVATRDDNSELRAKVAERWKMKPDQIVCRGCKSEEALFNCEVRQCAAGRRVATCAHCGDFASCEKEMWTKSPTLTEKIRQIRMNPRI